MVSMAFQYFKLFLSRCSNRYVIPLFCYVGLSFGYVAGSQAAFSIFIEPYLGYSQISFVSDSIFGPLTEEAYAAVLGGKGGVNFTSDVFCGFDYHTAGPYQLDLIGREYNNKMFGAGIGRRFGAFRIWVAHYFLDDLEDYNKFIKYVGTGYKLSLGKEFSSKLSLNLEFVHHIVDHEDSTIVSAPTPTTTKYQVLFISVSAPLKF